MKTLIALEHQAFKVDDEPHEKLAGDKPVDSFVREVSPGIDDAPRRLMQKQEEAPAVSQEETQFFSETRLGNSPVSQ